MTTQATPSLRRQGRKSVRVNRRAMPSDITPKRPSSELQLELPTPRLDQEVNDELEQRFDDERHSDKSKSLGCASVRTAGISAYPDAAAAVVDL